MPAPDTLKPSLKPTDRRLKMDDDQTYCIKRFYSPSDGRPTEVVREGLTREEAMEHCSDDDTHEPGVYFDGFEKE
jgi:hypothetical protein